MVSMETEAASSVGESKIDVPLVRVDVGRERSAAPRGQIRAGAVPGSIHPDPYI